MFNSFLPWKFVDLFADALFFTGDEMVVIGEEIGEHTRIFSESLFFSNDKNIKYTKVGK